MSATIQIANCVLESMLLSTTLKGNNIVLEDVLFKVNSPKIIIFDVDGHKLRVEATNPILVHGGINKENDQLDYGFMILEANRITTNIPCTSINS